MIASAPENSLVIVGAGFIGSLLDRHFSVKMPTRLISSRELISGSTLPDFVGTTTATVVFAHGMPVNRRDFHQRYDEILQSRVRPLEILSGLPFSQVILISSTAAVADGGNRSLATLQRAYEQQFERCFPKQKRIVLRVGTLVAEGSQFSLGLELLRKSLVLKRLRCCGPPGIPWTEPKMVCAAVEMAMEFATSANWIVAHRTPLNLNDALDEVSDRLRIPIPQQWFSAIWQALGVQSEFMFSHDALREPDGWEFAPTSLEESDK